MRTLMDIAGLLIACLGVIMTMVGCLGATVAGPAGGVIFWIGLALIAIGWAVSSTATHKVCPTCRETVKHKALKCKHCGTELGGKYNVAQRHV